MRQYVRWRTHMSQIRPYYAVRCNSSPTVIEVLATLGTGFICTNKVLSHMLDHTSVQVSPQTTAQSQYTLLRLSVQESENSLFSESTAPAVDSGYSIRSTTPLLSHSGQT